ncbi:hypothetical protein [Pseudomonas sp. 25 R 14]|nr:hypothetical protein [Pseudomonas sp. 25 R 14]
MLWAKPPMVAGRAFIDMPVMRSNRVADRITSVFLPAVSSKWARTTRSTSSNPVPISRPITSTHKVDVAWFGTTRS